MHLNKTYTETDTIELKEKVSNTFLKTVTAFANYNDGKIIFGIKDTGEAVGVENMDETADIIENKIMDNITPTPDFSLELDHLTNLVTVCVSKGPEPPYFYKSKSYKRSHTSTRELNILQLKRLILEGMNINYEDQLINAENLKFETLEQDLKEKLEVEILNKDVLTSLNLYVPNKGYNTAAFILSDSNNCPGCDIVKYGKDINTIKNRKAYQHTSILTLFNNAMKMYSEYYTEEVIKGAYRRKIELIPKEAFREALANALIHRQWDVGANVQISMHEDKVEIVSPGGLPDALLPEEFGTRQLSVLRNPIIAGIFARLGIVERFGTGIARIKKSYSNSYVKPKFEASSDCVTVTLPILKTSFDLNPCEELIYDVLKRRRQASSADLVRTTGFSKSKVVRILNHLISLELIKSTGIGKATRYSLE